MTTLDMFGVIVILTFTVGVFSMVLTYIVYSGLTYLQTATANIPVYPGFDIISHAKAFSLFIPTFAALMIVALIGQAFILSFFIKAHPLSAIIALLLLFGYTIISFYVSNTLIQIARLPLFSPFASSSNFLFFFFLNLPVILVVCSVVDIGIALTAART